LQSVSIMSVTCLGLVCASVAVYCNLLQSVAVCLDHTCESNCACLSDEYILQIQHARQKLGKDKVCAQRAVSDANNGAHEVCCSMLQHVAVCRSVLPCVAPKEHARQELSRDTLRVQRIVSDASDAAHEVCCSVLQCVAVC